MTGIIVEETPTQGSGLAVPVGQDLLNENPLTAKDLFPRIEMIYLWGYIGFDAYALAAQVCKEMVRLEVSQLIYQWDKAVQTCVFDASEFLVGPPVDGDDRYVEALQDLHFRGGLWNAITEDRLYEPDTQGKHFTLSPTQHLGRHYSRSTPVYFRVANITVGQFDEWMNHLVTEQTKNSQHTLL